MEEVKSLRYDKLWDGKDNTELKKDLTYLLNFIVDGVNTYTRHISGHNGCIGPGSASTGVTGQVQETLLRVSLDTQSAGQVKSCERGKYLSNMKEEVPIRELVFRGANSLKKGARVQVSIQGYVEFDEEGNKYNPLPRKLEKREEVNLIRELEKDSLEVAVEYSFE